MQGYDGCLIFKWANGEKYSGLVNFIPQPITGENFLAIGQGKNHF